MRSQNKVFGNKGEEIATQFLEKRGYRIIARNFRTRNGEIDIIATNKKTLVFIEVKTRLSTDFGTPLEAITPWKMKALIRTAEFYKITHANLPELMRIDAIAITLEPDGNIIDIEHTENISY